MVCNYEKSTAKRLSGLKGCFEKKQGGIVVTGRGANEVKSIEKDIRFSVES